MPTSTVPATSPDTSPDGSLAVEDVQTSVEDGEDIEISDVTIEADGTVTVTGTTSDSDTPEQIEVLVTTAAGEQIEIPVESSPDGSGFEFAWDPAATTDISTLSELLGSRISVDTPGSRAHAEIGFERPGVSDIDVPRGPEPGR